LRQETSQWTKLLNIKTLQLWTDSSLFSHFSFFYLWMWSWHVPAAAEDIIEEGETKTGRQLLKMPSTEWTIAWTSVCVELKNGICSPKCSPKTPLTVKRLVKQSVIWCDDDSFASRPTRPLPSGQSKWRRLKNCDNNTTHNQPMMKASQKLIKHWLSSLHAVLRNPSRNHLFACVTLHCRFLSYRAIRINKDNTNKIFQHTDHRKKFARWSNLKFSETRAFLISISKSFKTSRYDGNLLYLL